jgi:hypothetical protein
MDEQLSALEQRLSSVFPAHRIEFRYSDGGCRFRFVAYDDKSKTYVSSREDLIHTWFIPHRYVSRVADVMHAFSRSTDPGT